MIRIYRNHLLPFLLAVLPAGFALAADDGAEDAPEGAIDPERAANFVGITEIAAKNLGIESVAVIETEFETTFFAVGRIEEIPANRSALSSRISGRIVELHAFEGDLVREGQVLAKVESRQFGDPPPSIELKALRDGVIVESHARLGEPVEPDREILDISDRSEVWAVARIPEQKAHLAGPGTRARIRIAALGDKTMEAELIRYGVSADRKAGTLDGIFKLPNADLSLRPGMRVEFSVITSSRSDVMAVPHEAIQGDPVNRKVFVRDFDIPNGFLRSPVHLGEKNDQYVEIISGVLPGDDVVTRGSYGLSFVNPEKGLSLKDELDRAHGHEHNEDGSELTAAQKAAKAKEGKGGHEHAGEHEHHIPTWIIAYAAIATVLCIVFGQLYWRKRKPLAA